jgi:C-terminal processing protease CtpA/Prc
VDELSPDLADEVINYLGETQNFIFDVRNNQGGSELFGNNLIRHFVHERTANKIIKFKNGPGHTDFSLTINYIYPGSVTREYNHIIVLTNRVTFSAGNDFANNFSVLPNVTVIGDTTGGGGSTPFIYEFANGWRLRYASNMQLRASDSLIIDRGISPDIYVEMQQSSVKDNVLDTAIDFLNY